MKNTMFVFRSRLGVIPQEPFIFSGSVLENVDPLRQHGEVEVSRALAACGASDAVEARGGLHAPAAHLARGHAQLLCLARALLQRSKVTVSFNTLYSFCTRFRPRLRPRGNKKTNASSPYILDYYLCICCLKKQS